MRIPIPCHKIRFRLTVGLRVAKPTTVRMVGEDAEYPANKYVYRDLNFKLEDFEGNSAYKEIKIPFPLAPDFMMFYLWDGLSPETKSFRVEKFEVEPMEPRELWDHPDVHEFIPFASWFAQNAGHLSTGKYMSKDGQFLIEYLPVIRSYDGRILTTPARTHRTTGRMQFSQKLIVPLSVPIRVFIEIHELKHFQLPTRKEKVADMSALRVFLDLGFPKIEAIYAATRAMNALTPKAREMKGQRLHDIHAFVDNYMQREKSNELTYKRAA